MFDKILVALHSRPRQLETKYDTLQGKYGREGFSYRHAPGYFYLSSLVAGYPDVELNEADRENILEFYKEAEYLLYKV